MPSTKGVTVSPQRLAVLAAAGAVATGAFAATGLASTPAPLFWQNPTHKIDCGIMLGYKQVLCSAKKIPAPPHTSSKDGDPGFVSIGKTGKPKLLRLSQDSFVSDKIKTQKANTTWTFNSVTCSVAATTVTCTNKSGHGFEIDGPGKGYRSF
jgi:hypothetical protein